MSHRDWALELVSQECVGASPDDANQDEKDLQDLGSGINARVTPAPVQLHPGWENVKEPQDEVDFTGKRKGVCSEL